jgi:hypothetical protein
VTAIAANDVWAAGGYDNGKAIFLPLFEHWDGHKWSVVSSSFVPNASLQTLSTAETSDIWAAGSYSRAANDNSIWLIEHWDGSRWTVKAPSPDLRHGFRCRVRP